MMNLTCETIQRCEVAFHPHSFADSDGRLFCWRNQLFRGISSAQTPFFLRLFQNGTIQSLIEKGLLIDSRLTPLSLEGFGLVVSHKAVPFISYPQEWCAAMLKDAALMLLNLLIELAGKDLTLKDAHPWNILFDGCKPVYVDLTSIVPLEGDCQWQAYEEFCHYCYYPLILMSLGQERIARSLLPEYGGVQRKEVLSLAPYSLLSRFILSRLMRRGLAPVLSLLRKKQSGADGRLNFLHQLRKDVKRLHLPLRAREGGASLNPGIRAEQQEVLHRVLSDLKPASVLDVNAREGWGAKLAAKTARQVISLSAETEAVTQLYYEARNHNLPILPLVLDFVKPTPSVGYSDHYLIAATERLKCEMVLALSLVRRTVYEYFLPFDLIAEGLASFSARWLVVEFNPPVELLSGEEKVSLFPWYSLENFEEALKKKFYKVEALAKISDGSVLFLCEK